MCHILVISFLTFRQIFQKKINYVYHNHKYLYQGICSFHPGMSPFLLGSLAAPSDPGFLATPCAILQLCNAALLSRRNRQPPQTRFAPPKLPQPLVDLVDVASPLAGRIGCICLPVWKFTPQMLSELVWDGRSRVT